MLHSAGRPPYLGLALGVLLLSGCQAERPGPSGAGAPTADIDTRSAPTSSETSPSPTDGGTPSAPPDGSRTTDSGTQTESATESDAATQSAFAPTDEAQPSGPAEQVLATGFEVPWGLVVLADGTALVGERDTAQIWRLTADSETEILGTVPGVVPGGEGGLLGLAVPEGADDGVLYAYATTEQDNRVLRVDTSGAQGSGGDLPAETVLDGIPKAGNHNGGRIEFGPDDFLYVTTGDASEGALSQDPGSLGGKILRITADGEPAPGNPDPDSPVWSLGHRNVQGLDWDEDGRLWASEFGQNAFDEVNLIEPGGNYGWPQVEGTGGEPEFIDPVVTWSPSEASPSGLAVGPDGDLYVAALRGQSLWRVPVDGSGEVGEPERLLEGEYGRLRSVVTDVDGRLWVLTNNTARGEPQEGDDRLLLLDPAQLGP
jgi:glucose/arabinose dehydrogenase